MAPLYLYLYILYPWWEGNRNPYFVNLASPLDTFESFKVIRDGPSPLMGIY